MSACWMLVMLLGCRLSRATQSDTICPCNYHRQILSSTIPVPCPQLTGNVVEFSLYKDKDMLYRHKCQYLRNASNCTIDMDNGIRLQENNESIMFMLSGEMAFKHGVYSCQAKVLYPPPYKAEQEKGILVRERGHECQCSTQEHRTPEWVWILVALLAVYSITITIVVVVKWVRMRDIDSQNDYINTKPKPAKDNRRNRHRPQPTIHF